MQAFLRETGIAVPFDERNIDTDQIVPARFLKWERSNPDYGRLLFHDLRFNEQGAERADFILNREPFRAAQIIVAGSNFGCGSSREAAVYALHAFGIRALIAPSYGDIFYSNCLKNGIVPVRLDENIVSGLLVALQKGGDKTVLIDLEQMSVTLPGGAVHHFDIDPFWRECLMKGVDDLELTLSHTGEIEKFELAYYDEMPWARL